MKRKVIKQGHNTLTITLPRKWCDSIGIKGGDDIELSQKDEQLIIGSESKSFTETTIHLSKNEIIEDKEKKPNKYTVRTILINALRKGHDIIKITFESQKILPIINDCVSEVIGYEITEQGSDFCTVSSMVHLKEIDFENYISRFKHILRTFSNLVNERVVLGNDNKEEIESMFLMAEKNFNSFCRFLMRGHRERTKEKIFLFYATGHLYEGIRNMFYSSRLYNKLNRELSANSLKYAKDVFKYVNKVMDFVDQKDVSKISELNLEKNKLTYHKINELICKNSKENEILLQLSFVARRMWDSVGPYTGYII